MRVQEKAYQDLIRFPALVSDQGSLSPMEKSLLGHLLLLVRPQVIVELGVFRAVTTQFICEFLQENEIDAQVFGFDLPDVIANLREMNSAVQKHEAMSRLHLVPGRLPVVLQEWIEQANGPIDFALVDATHDYRSVMAELTLLWSALAPDGYILCHDYSLKYDGVRHAVNHFSAKVGARMLPLVSSEQARQQGHASVLVVLCRRSFQPTMRSLARHRWLKAKTDLLEYRLINSVWQHVVKPLIRKGDR